MVRCSPLRRECRCTDFIGLRMAVRDGMRTALRRRAPTRRDERGIALVIVILTLFVLTTLAAAVIFVTQSEIWTSANYKLATQARYAAEAGSQRAANWLVHDYTPPPHLETHAT